MGLSRHGPLGLRKMWDSVAVDHSASGRCGTQSPWATQSQEDVRVSHCSPLGLRKMRAEQDGVGKSWE